MPDDVPCTFAADDGNVDDDDDKDDDDDGDDDNEFADRILTIFCFLEELCFSVSC